MISECEATHFRAGLRQMGTFGGLKVSLVIGGTYRTRSSLVPFAENRPEHSTDRR